MGIHKRLIDIDSAELRLGLAPTAVGAADERALRELMRIQVPDSVNIEIVLRT